jgi:hypothetical protein
VKRKIIEDGIMPGIAPRFENANVTRKTKHYGQTFFFSHLKPDENEMKKD